MRPPRRDVRGSLGRATKRLTCLYLHIDRCSRLRSRLTALTDGFRDTCRFRLPDHADDQ
ncbi:hypothetical protein ABT001_32835 [Streptomyces sp. NPDC002793]|uniref:hypothetical protein n=1 Tax=Streptomyces TaxID=1883 RepID=UPI00331A2ABD